MEEKTGGELQPGTVNVKLNYRGIMVRQRGRGKMKFMFLREQGRGGWKAAEGVKVRDKGEHREAQIVTQGGRDKVQQQVEGCKTESSISVFLME